MNILNDRLEYSDRYRYATSFIDTETDEPIAVRYAKDLTGLKRGIKRQLKFEEFDGGRYDNTDYLVLYVKDSEYFTETGKARLADICNKHPDMRKWIKASQEHLHERGLDFDIWHDYYLTEEERAEYDAIKVH